MKKEPHTQKPPTKDKKAVEETCPRCARVRAEWPDKEGHVQNGERFCSVACAKDDPEAGD